jgi:hypothetical protein
MYPLIIPQDSAKRAIIEGRLPKYSVKIFGIPLLFQFTDIASPSGPIHQLEYFEQIIFCPQLPDCQFLRELPSVFYHEIVRVFCETQSIVSDQIFQQLDDFLETDESRNYWGVYKNSRPELAITIIDNRLNYLQRKWILINAQKDKKDTVNFVTQVFDALKPWLNSELFQHIQEVEENCRENVFYDDDNMTQIDKQLQEKARKLMAARKQTTNLDEITIEDNNA